MNWATTGGESQVGQPQRTTDLWQGLMEQGVRATFYRQVYCGTSASQAALEHTCAYLAHCEWGGWRTPWPGACPACGPNILVGAHDTRASATAVKGRSHPITPQKVRKEEASLKERQHKAPSLSYDLSHGCGGMPRSCGKPAGRVIWPVQLSTTAGTQCLFYSSASVGVSRHWKESLAKSSVQANEGG